MFATSSIEQADAGISRFTGILVAAALTACSAAPSPAATAPATEPQAAPPAAAAAAPKTDPAAEQCLATAGAKRARFSGEAPKIGVRHLLVKYKGATRADASITRTREAACLRAMEARDKLRGGADFASLVKEFSEEPGAATRQGSLGAVERKDLAKPFADAAFELSPNQFSDVVETEFGFHVVFRYE